MEPKLQGDERKIKGIKRVKRILSYKDSNKTAEEIGEIFGISGRSVWSLFNYHGVKKKPSKKYYEEKKEWRKRVYWRLLRAGYKVEDFARVFGIKEKAVNSYLLEWGFRKPKERQQWKKRVCKRLLESGYTVEDIARVWGQSVDTVQHYLYRKKLQDSEKFSKWKKRVYVRLMEAGYTAEDIARVFGTRVNTVKYFMLQNGLKERRFVYHHVPADLIHKMWAVRVEERCSLEALSKRFGVSRPIIVKCFLEEYGKEMYEVTKARTGVRDKKVCHRDFVKMVRLRMDKWSCQRIADEMSLSKPIVIKYMKAANLAGNSEYDSRTKTNRKNGKSYYDERG